MTTALYPAGASATSSSSWRCRLMISVTGNLKRSQTLALQEHQIRSTAEMLELRSITDRQYDTPARMLDAFLNCLRIKTSADRGVLFLTTPEGSLPGQAVARCGTSLPPHLTVKWHEHEAALIIQLSDRNGPTSLDPADLEKAGVDTLIGSAVVVPLISRRGTIGSLCLTRQSREPFSRTQVQLAQWAAEHLAETIARILAQAVVERQARQDGLTELANRRAFRSADRA